MPPSWMQGGTLAVLKHIVTHSEELPAFESGNSMILSSSLCRDLRYSLQFSLYFTSFSALFEPHTCLAVSLSEATEVTSIETQFLLQNLTMLLTYILFCLIIILFCQGRISLKSNSENSIEVQLAVILENGAANTLFTPKCSKKCASSG